MEDKHLLILCIQYHGCWWPGNTRIQGISEDDIELMWMEYCIAGIGRVKASNFMCLCAISSAWWFSWEDTYAVELCLFLHQQIKLIDYRYVDGLVQDCSISSALALEILQSCTKPSISSFVIGVLSLQALDRCKLQEEKIESMSVPLTELRQDAQAEFDKVRNKLDAPSTGSAILSNTWKSETDMIDWNMLR